MHTTFKFRRDFPIAWALTNPVLAAGEPGFELGTNKLKIGDGVTRWSLLKYFVPVGDGTPGGGPSDEELQAHIDSNTPHPIYDDGPSLVLLYENAKV